MADQLVLILIIAVLGIIVVGALLGFASFFEMRRLRSRIEYLEGEIASLQRRVRDLLRPDRKAPESAEPQQAPTPAAQPLERPILEEQIAPPPAPPSPIAPPLEPTPSAREDVLPDHEQLAPSLKPRPREFGLPRVVPPPSTPRTPSVPETSPHAFQPSFEFALGSKWIVWLGAVFSIIGMGYALKYAYDMGWIGRWIGPGGRIAIGVCCGILSMILGEKFRRKDWLILFYTLTGTGLAAFYLCIFFSFQVYKLSNQSLSFGLAVAVTALAVTLAVARNSVGVAVFAVIGGFLSPFLISTGENHPYVLFSYILLLDLVAMSAAYFRRWPGLDIFCFAGTILVYALWYGQFYAPDQMTPALLFISLIYVFFLLIPILHTLVRRLPETNAGLTLLVANVCLALMWYYRILYHDYEKILGGVVLAQAAAVFILHQAWVRRVGSKNLTAECLIVIALALVTASVPLELNLYGIAIAWAVEGALLNYVGVRIRRPLVEAMGVIALVLAAWKLVDRLPLHTAHFIPVFNVSFGSWMFVVAACAIAAWIPRPNADAFEKWRKLARVGALLLGFVLFVLLLSMETWFFWEILHPGPYVKTHALSSLVVLWTLIAFALTLALQLKARFGDPWFELIVSRARMALEAMALIALYLAAIELFNRLPLHAAPFRPILNAAFGSWVVVIAASLFAAWIARRVKDHLDQWRILVIVAPFLFGFVMSCYLLSLEVGAFWEILHPGPNFRIHRLTSLIVLWSLITFAVTLMLELRKQLTPPWLLLSPACAAVAFVFFIGGLAQYDLNSTWLVLNAACAPRLVFPLVLFWGAYAMRRAGRQDGEMIAEAATQLVLAILVAAEFTRWSAHSTLVSERMGFSMISAAWSLQAFALIWSGLARRYQLRRVLGFLLFGITVLKVLVVDTSELAPVYRILSFIASGLLLLTAGYFYHRYAATLFGIEPSGKNEP